MTMSFRLVVLFVALFGLVTASHAAPISYSVSGIASGQLDSSTFVDALVTVTVNADTDDIVATTDDFDANGAIETIYAVASLLTTVNVAGLGTVNVFEPTAIYAFPGFENVDPGEDLFLLPLVVIGTLDSPPSLESFTGIGGLASNALSGYDLATSIPSMVGAGGVARSPAFPLSTSGGSLTFASNDFADSPATFAATADVPVVPEPASLSLLASGLLSLAGCARLRKRA